MAIDRREFSKLVLAAAGGVLAGAACGSSQSAPQEPAAGTEEKPAEGETEEKPAEGETEEKPAEGETSETKDEPGPGEGPGTDEPDEPPVRGGCGGCGRSMRQRMMRRR